MAPGPDGRPRPGKAEPAPGRCHVLQHNSPHETQAVLMTDADVVNWLTDPDDIES
ncbi:hypothetical protein [Streptomyces rimosus]|uniref:hypothetical protein n=1 Tax=Streptomyces rimosus TaxID=1927 RepID=UPI0037CF085A